MYGPFLLEFIFVSRIGLNVGPGQLIDLILPSLLLHDYQYFFRVFKVTPFITNNYIS